MLPNNDWHCPMGHAVDQALWWSANLSTAAYLDRIPYNSFLRVPNFVSSIFDIIQN